MDFRPRYSNIQLQYQKQLTKIITCAINKTETLQKNNVLTKDIDTINGYFIQFEGGSHDKSN